MKSLCGTVLLSLLIVLSCAGVVCGPRTHDYTRLIVNSTLAQKAYYEGQLAFINSVSRDGNPYRESNSKRATEWELGWRERHLGRIRNVVSNQDTSGVDESL